MKERIVRDLAHALDTQEPRAVRARRVSEMIRAARGYRWVGIYDVGDDEIAAIGFSGETPEYVRFPKTRGLNGEAVRTRETVICNDVRTDRRYLTAFRSTGSEMIVPILGAESGIVIGTLDVESDRVDAFSEEDRAFVEACAPAVMPLFE